MIELSQLRCFVAVGEELHFGRAALRLNMTQPPLCRQIRLLEHQVGTPLLTRTNRVVRFTAAGKAFFPEAARILRLADESTTTARRVARRTGVDRHRLHRRVRLWPVARDGSPPAPAGAARVAHAQGDGDERADRSARCRPDRRRPDAPAPAARKPEDGDARSRGPDARDTAAPGQALAEGADAVRTPRQAVHRLLALRGELLLPARAVRARPRRREPDVVDYVPQIHTMLALVDSGLGRRA